MVINTIKNNWLELYLIISGYIIGLLAIFGGIETSNIFFFLYGTVITPIIIFLAIFVVRENKYREIEVR